MDLTSSKDSPKRIAIDKLKSIFSLKKNDQTKYDTSYNYQLKMLFGAQEDSFKFLFNEHSQFAAIIYKIVDLLYIVMKIPKNKRELFYETNVFDIKDMTIMKIFGELTILQKYEFDIKDGQMVNLYNIISDILEQKQVYTLSEYIDSILLKLSFFPGVEPFLKFQLYSMILQYYLGNFGVVLNFNEEEINITESKSLDLIIGLFQMTELDITCLIQSIIILNYGSLSEVIKNKTIDEIILGINDMSSRLKSVKNIGNMILCVESIIEMFTEEMEQEKYKNKKKKKSKTLKKPDNNKKVQGESINSKSKKLEKPGIIMQKNIGERDISININKENNKISTQSNANNQIESQSKENIRDNSKINIINLINNIITKISMGNMDIKQDIDNLQKSILDIVDKNDKMKEKIDKMEMNISKQHQDIVKLTEDNQKQNQDIVKQNQDIVKLTEDNQKQNQDIEELKERVEFLEGECDDLKEMLSKIQFRGLSKNFLRCFHTYLEEDDWKIIERNKKLKGEVISKKIAKLYPNADKKKLQIIQNLVKKASNLLNKGNSLAHSVTLSRYQKEIIDYKEKNKLDKIASPALFCFVVSLEISQGFDEPFENSLSFLSRYFQQNLVSAKPSDFLESYFSN